VFSRWLTHLPFSGLALASQTGFGSQASLFEAAFDGLATNRAKQPLDLLVNLSLAGGWAPRAG